MERIIHQEQYGFFIILSLIVSLALISSSLCIVAEFKKSKENDLRLDGKLCYLPGSDAFGLGIAAVICLSAAHVIGNLVMCTRFRRSNGRVVRVRKSTVIAAILSWMSFGIAVILIGIATSMSRDQGFGEGWLDGECYLVKDGVLIGSAILILLWLGSTLASAIVLTTRQRPAEEEDRRKVHAQQ